VRKIRLLKKVELDMSRKSVNMQDEKHGCLQVVSASLNKGKDKLWNCFCNICGNTVELRRTQILRAPKKCTNC